MLKMKCNTANVMLRNAEKRKRLFWIVWHFYQDSSAASLASDSLLSERSFDLIVLHCIVLCAIVFVCVVGCPWDTIWWGLAGLSQSRCQHVQGLHPAHHTQVRTHIMDGSRSEAGRHHVQAHRARLLYPLLAADMPRHTVRVPSVHPVEAWPCDRW